MGQCNRAVAQMICAIAVVLALSACTPLLPTQLQSSNSTNEVNPPDSHSQVVLVIPEEPSSLNPYWADERLGPSIIHQVADATTAGLSVVDQNGEFQPVLAEAIPSLADGTITEDFLSVTWKLRPGLLWSDGVPITSDDIKFTWEAVTHPESGALLSNHFEKIASIDTPDELTAVVHYAEVNRAYAIQFAYGLLPRHATGTADTMETWAWNRKPVTGGPFVVSEWTSGDSIVMERNPNYYLAGQPYLDQLIFKVLPDPAERMAMMVRGEGDVHLWPDTAKEYYDLQADGQATLREVPGRWNMALRFNLSEPFDDDTGPLPPHSILGDMKVRQALAHALDYDTIISHVNPGVFPATTPFAYGWYRCEMSRTFSFDTDRANSLLDEAGWVKGEDGIRVAAGAVNAADGTRLSLYMQGYSGFAPLLKLEEAIAAMWRDVGVETIIQNDNFSIIFGSLANGSPRKIGDFDVLIYDSSLDIEPHETIVNQFHSSSIPTANNPAGANYSRWVNAGADAAIEMAGSTADLSARRAAYCNLAQRINDDLPQLHLYLFTEGYGVSDRLDGYAINIWGSLTWDAQNWKLSQYVSE